MVLNHNALFTGTEASCPVPLWEVKDLPATWETQVQSLGGEDPQRRLTATHSSILAWEILWTEEPGGLQSMGSPKNQTQ